MFKLLKRLLKINKKDVTIYDKINRIRDGTLDLRYLYTIQCYFAYDNIIKYTDEISNINSFDILNNKIYFNIPNVVNKEFLYWLSIDGRMNNNPKEDINRFLDQCYELICKYNMYINVKSNGIINYNLRKIQTHIIYIEAIIECIYNSLIKDSSS